MVLSFEDIHDNCSQNWGKIYYVFFEDPATVTYITVLIPKFTSHLKIEFHCHVDLLDNTPLRVLFHRELDMTKSVFGYCLGHSRCMGLIYCKRSACPPFPFGSVIANETTDVMELRFESEHWQRIAGRMLIAPFRLFAMHMAKLLCKLQKLLALKLKTRE